MINNKIDNKIIHMKTNNYNHRNINNNNNDDDIEIELDRKYNELPKNHGKIWTNKDKKTLLDLLKNNETIDLTSFFDENNIYKISKKLHRTEASIREEIKKMIMNDFLDGYSYSKLSKKYYIPDNIIKNIIKKYIDKNYDNLITSIENENKLLKIKIENVKLKKELFKLNKYDKLNNDDDDDDNNDSEESS